MNEMSDFPIYLVSLDSDIERRDALKKMFPRSYSKFIFDSSAVDGRKLSAKEYYDKVVASAVSSGRLMSPSELGCTLSHMAVLEKFLESGHEKALIIEDDIIGDDQNLIDIIDSSKYVKENSLYICGGQQGTSVRKFLVANEEVGGGLYKLSEFSKGFILRTCCYVVTKTSARKVLDFYSEKMSVADSWGEISKSKSFDILYSNSLKHPLDLGVSHIELERMNYKSKSIKKKLFSRGLVGAFFAPLFRYVWLYSLIMIGYDRLDVD